jgi:hypothetical protein
MISKKLIAQRKWKKENKEHVYKERTKWNKDNIEKVREYKRKWQKNNNEKVEAQNLLNTAIMKGIIVKEACSVCGDIKSQAHHPDYSKPLEVIWLCQQHHKDLHVKLKEAATA